jgi:hypothetical protein
VEVNLWAAVSFTFLNHWLEGQQIPYVRRRRRRHHHHQDMSSLTRFVLTGVAIYLSIPFQVFLDFFFFVDCV